MSQTRYVPVIGLIGGIGSGKTSVANWVAGRRPVCVIDADAIGHEVLQRPGVRNELAAAFGEGILGPRGTIDRRRLGSLVFGTTAAQRSDRKTLERIVHPRIREAISETISRAKASLLPEAIILDAAILLEAGWNGVCTAVVFVDSPLEARQQRVLRSRGWSGDDLHKRESSQLSLDEKKSHADLIISNHSTLEHAGQKLEEFIDQLIAAGE